MADILDNLEPLLPAPPSRGRRIFKFAGIFLLVILILAVVVFGASAAYISIYNGKVYPGVYAGSYALRASEPEDVKKFIEDLNNKLSKEGVMFAAKTSRAELEFKLNTVSAGDAGELIALDGDALAARAFAVGRAGPWYQKLFSPWSFFWSPHHLPAPLLIDEKSVADILTGNLTKISDAPRDAGVKFRDWPNGQVEIIPEAAGQDFDINAALELMRNNLAQLNFGTITLTARNFSPAIKLADAQKAAPRAREILNYGNLSLNYIDPQTKARREWTLDAATLGGWLAFKKDDAGTVIFALDETQIREYLTNLRGQIDEPAQNAKFVVENGKVKEFQASRSGLKLDLNKTMTDLTAAFIQRNYHQSGISKAVNLTVQVAEPDVKISGINGFGIEEVVGVGVSSFAGSPKNRIKNITNAVKLLNGALVKPGEEFSTLRLGGPYTEENGYYPELVIKGDEIIPEVGGGMCQIGTTVFRMAMNAGMDITARRNHSLVVHYYSDPVNGKPGTDATIYEPYLDMKFKNDTGGYLLLQAEVDYKKQELVFTLWGQSDGRKGWYTHPEVSKWIPAGETQTRTTDTLKPGEKKCQEAHKGAVANFTYSRITSSSQKIDRVFESFYRPLPQICLIGATSTPAVEISGDIAPATILDAESAGE